MIYITSALLSAPLYVRPRYLLPPINSNYLFRQIRSHTERVHMSAWQHKSGTRGSKNSDTTNIILSLNLISVSPVDKLHSSIIKADLE